MGIETPPVPVPAALDSALGVVAAVEESDSSLEAVVVGVKTGLRIPPVPRRLVTGETMGSRRPPVLEASSLAVELVGWTIGIETPPVPVPAALEAAGVDAAALVSEARASEVSDSVLVVG